MIILGEEMVAQLTAFSAAKRSDRRRVGL